MAEKVVEVGNRLFQRRVVLRRVAEAEEPSSSCHRRLIPNTNPYHHQFLWNQKNETDYFVVDGVLMFFWEGLLALEIVLERGQMKALETVREQASGKALEALRASRASGEALRASGKALEASSAM